MALIRLKVVAAVTISPQSTARSLVIPTPPKVLIEPVEPEVESVASLCLRSPAVISIALFAVDALEAVSNKDVFVFVVPVLVTLIAKPWATTLALVLAPDTKIPATRWVAPVNPVVVDVRVKREPEFAAEATALEPVKVRFSSIPEVREEEVP